MVETKLTRDAVKTRVIETIVTLLGTDREQATEEAHLNQDLMVDSLDFAELVLALEREFGREIPDEAAEKLTTVGELIEHIFTNQD